MLIFLLPKLGVTHGEELLPIQAADSLAAGHDERTVQTLPLLAVADITAGDPAGTDGLMLSRPLHHQLSSQITQDPQQVAQTIFTLQGQTDSLAAVVRQNCY